jgi:hypothetical protein
MNGSCPLTNQSCDGTCARLAQELGADELFGIPVNLLVLMMLGFPIRVSDLLNADQAAEKQRWKEGGANESGPGPYSFIVVVSAEEAPENSEPRGPLPKGWGYQRPQDVSQSVPVESIPV